MKLSGGMQPITDSKTTTPRVLNIGTFGRPPTLTSSSAWPTTLDATPAIIARADLLRLLALTGFDHTNWAWREVLTGAEDPVLVMPDAVLIMIEWATTSEGERGG